ncbi:hypothetical protein YC2023_091970 [Brassica napus]
MESAKNCFDEIAVKDVCFWTALIYEYHAPSEAGADILLDSLRMGTLTAAQNILLDGDLLSIHENNASRATIETFSSTSPFASFSMMDL